MSVPWTMYIRLHRTHWACGAKGLSLIKAPCSPVPPTAPFCPFRLLLYSHLLLFLLLFFPVPFSLSGPARAQYSPFWTYYEHKMLSEKGRQYHLGRTDPLTAAHTAHCWGSSDTQGCSSTAAKQFKNQQCWKLCNAQARLTEHSAARYQVTVAGAGKDLSFFFFPFFPRKNIVLARCKTSAKIPNVNDQWPPD